MASAVSPDVIVYICHRSIPQGARLPRQWRQDGAHVLVKQVPCSGKTDAQYLMHAIEGGGLGLCVVACPNGECRLAQGNHRAELRVRTVRKLLAEIGLEAGRAELVRSSGDDPPERFEATVREAVARIVALGPSPVHAQV